MKKHNKKILQLGLVALSLVVFLLSTAGALGIVWLRQQISKTAESCLEKEKELIILERKNVHLRSKIAHMHNPEYLKEKLTAKLTQPSKKQIVWMDTNQDKTKMRHLAAKSKDRQTFINTQYQSRS